MKFLELSREPKVIYTDKSLEFGKACEDLSWNHCTSTPHRSETHGIAERAVRSVKEETSAVLLQSGLIEEWWAYSLECYWNLRNIQDLLSGGKTRRFGITFNGPIIPFGATVEYNTVSAQDISRLHQFGPKVLPGIFLVYVLCAGESGKETLWSQTLKKWRRWTHLNSTPEGSMSTPQRSGNFIFPFAYGKVQIFGWEQRLRTSTFTQERLERGEEQEILQGSSDEEYAPSHLQEDSTRDDEEVKNDFWAITGKFIYRHHVEPWVKLYVPREESFTIPMKYIDGTRTTYTSLDVLVEKILKITGNVDGEWKLSDAWTGFTRFVLLKERPPEGYTCCGERLARKQSTSRPDDIWPDKCKHMSDVAKKKAKQKWAIEKSKIDNARQLRRMYFIEPDDEEFKYIMKAARRKLEVPMPAAMLCKIPIKSSGWESTAILENASADESTRPRLEGTQKLIKITSLHKRRIL